MGGLQCSLPAFVTTLRQMTEISMVQMHLQEGCESETHSPWATRQSESSNQNMTGGKKHGNCIQLNMLMFDLLETETALGLALGPVSNPTVQINSMNQPLGVENGGRKKTNKFAQSQPFSLHSSKQVKQV